MTQVGCGVSPISSAEWKNRHPSTVASILFFLLFSGPPRFRQRDPTASLRGDIDAVVILHVLVWVVAGLWIFFQMRFYFQANAKPLRLGLPQKLGLGMVAALGLSTFVSVSPLLTAFMVYQMLISLMFTTVFVELYGVEACLRKLFQANAALCVATSVVAIVLPNLVFVTTETGALRLRGDYIAGTEGIALFCLLLLLGGGQKVSKIVYGFLLSLSCVLLVASLSRTAYLALFFVFLLVLFKRPRSKPFRRFACTFGGAAALGLAFGLTPALSEYRDPGSVSNLSDRLGLWTYLSHVTLQKSPFLGLGYYSASRVYGPQYNAAMGTAHSMFFETFSGGGFPATSLLVILCVVMTVYAMRVFRQNTELSFTVPILFLVTVMLGFIGATLDAGCVAITFWFLAASMPVLQNRGSAWSRVAPTFKKQLAEVR